MPQPRIYWLTEEFPPEVGGTGVVAGRLSHALADSVPVSVITRQTRPPGKREDRFGGARVRRIRPTGRLKGAGWRALPAMIAYVARLSAMLAIEARRYDIVVASGMKILPLAAIPICRMFHKRCVVRLESPFELVEPIAAESLHGMGRTSRTLSRLLGVLQRSLLARADRVVAISQEIESRLLHIGCSPERILRIPNPIDLERFHPAAEASPASLRERLRLPPSRTIVLYAGRLSRAKGVLMLIDGWSEVVRQHPDVCLVVVGSGRGSWDDCEDELRRLASERGLDDHVLFVGETTQVAEYMRAADLYVLPSEYEGFSLSLGEALGCGLLPIATFVGSAPELIEQGVN
ncbi:MAG: glycosyltransferase family 4 protein, partial [Steroidobacteraceae bacterium]